ncbi:hypothetical protein LWI29_036145 [Acer saccharum]|uniref:Retrovirus-related Pol polyprotein from transposon TNT 1-94-like beta-barrel domain-containing protein n=1 Tax=Acer saccharum TaxID=4024 RepID=A0AA39VCS2_ACESA|nr:hypothetical protein LWI29_036145 [Acer saccharum]
MTYDAGFFKELDRSYTSKVKIGNGDYVNVLGKGVVAVETSSGKEAQDGSGQRSLGWTSLASEERRRRDH